MKDEHQNSTTAVESRTEHAISENPSKGLSKKKVSFADTVIFYGDPGVKSSKEKKAAEKQPKVKVPTLCFKGM